ncbi:MAG: GNAT family N-acetyltransferase [Gammaproteobacteria bacterium]|nr:GNAT family N-acetyltransferase [Gammaproteobacteria bacterium]
MSTTRHVFSVRIAVPEDSAAVTALLQASYPVLMAAAYDEADLAPALDPMTKANERLLRSGTYYVAQAGNGTLLGCGGWTRERPGTSSVEPGVGHLRHFATHPGWARRGVGRAIYRRCEADARAAGIEEFECYASLNAQKFYAALGFDSVRSIVIDFPLGISLPAMLMRRPIGEQNRDSGNAPA